MTMTTFSWFPKATIVRTSCTRNCAKLHSEEKYLGRTFLNMESEEEGFLSGLSPFAPMSVSVPTSVFFGHVAHVIIQLEHVNCSFITGSRKPLALLRKANAVNYGLVDSSS